MIGKKLQHQKLLIKQKISGYLKDGKKTETNFGHTKIKKR